MVYFGIIIIILGFILGACIAMKKLLDKIQIDIDKLTKHFKKLSEGENDER